MPVEEEEREVKISDYYYKKSDIDTQMNNKVDKDGNKVLSDNNYTNADKAKLTNMTPADYVTSQSLSSTLSSYVVTSTLNNYYTQSEIDNIVNTINNNKISKSQTAGLVKNDGTIDTTTYSTASHTHGNLQTNGAIGTSNNANKNVITDANGKITTENKPTIPTKTSDLTNDGDGTNVFVKDNDSRLTNSRTPTSHSHGNITNNGQVTVNYDAIVQGTALIADDNDDGTLKTGLLSNAYIYDTSSLQNIDNNLDGNTEVSQENVNILINAKIGDIDTALNNKINKSSTTGLVKNDGTIDTNTYIPSSTLSSAMNGLYDNISLTYQPKQVGGGKSYENKNVVTDSTGKISVENKPVIPTNVSDLTNDAGYLTQHQSLDSKTITIEKQSTAETGYAATYIIKQGGTALSPKINIPKDYLVKSASLEVVGATPTTLETNNNLVTGDKYLKFVVNTQENDDITNLIIPVNDLGQEYDADNTTIVLNNGVFSVKSNVFADKTHTHSQYLTEHQSLSDYVQKSQTNGLIKNDGTIDTNTYLTQHQDITGKEDKSNKVTQWSSIVTDTNYPSEKLVSNTINDVRGSISGVYLALNNYQTKNMYTPNKNVVTDNSGYITTENKPTIPSASSTTPSADTTSGSVGTGTTWAKADHTHPKSSIYATRNHDHDMIGGGPLGIVLIRDDGNYGYGFDERIIYDKDENSLYYDKDGNGVNTSNEIATKGDIPNITGKANNSDFDTLTATVNYTDNTSETVTFYIVPNNSS